VRRTIRRIVWRGDGGGDPFVPYKGSPIFATLCYVIGYPLALFACNGLSS